MDAIAVGRRIKAAREVKHMTQEKLAETIDLSTDHISVIERGVKVPRLDTFVAIANALEVSADDLLIDVVDHAAQHQISELGEDLASVPVEQQRRILNAVRAFLE